MKKDVFEKAKKINSSINTLKKRKEQIELFKLNDNSKSVIIFGFQNTNHVILANNEIEYFSNFLIKKCDDEIKALETEFDKL